MIRRSKMKKIVVLTLSLIMIITLAACTRRLDEVESIQLNWLPQTWYDREESVPIGQETITINYTTGSPTTVRLDNPEVILSGNGIDGFNLFTEHVGEFSVQIAYEESTVSFSYKVNDQDLVDDLNETINNESQSKFRETLLVDKGEVLEKLGLGHLYLYALRHDPEHDEDYDTAKEIELELGTLVSTGWAGDIYNAVKGDSGADGLPGSVFADAVQAQKIIGQSIQHRIFTGDIRQYILDLTYEYLTNPDDVTFDRERFMGNLLEFYENSDVEGFRSSGEGYLPSQHRVDDYTAVLYGEDPGLDEIDDAILIQAALNGYYLDAYSEESDPVAAFMADYENLETRAVTNGSLGSRSNVLRMFFPALSELLDDWEYDYRFGS